MLEPLFQPQSVAVIGASRTPGKLGYAVLANMIDSGFPGPIYPINPQATEILGRPAFPALAASPGPVDLAVIVVPARHVLEALHDCGRKGVQAVIVISAGFRETGTEGLRAEREMGHLARKYGFRIVGPNCLGVIGALHPFNASFAAGMPRAGNIAFMSQSGALCTAVLDIALAENIGFSHFVSLGNKADLNEIDFLQAWDGDPHARVIMAYLEGITDGGKFIEVAGKVTKRTPVVAIKSGTTSGGARAVSSHTGTLAGSERAYEAAFKQAGVLRAGSVGELFDVAIAFARQPLPVGKRVAIVTNAGGPGIMATDAIERCGLHLANLSTETIRYLRDALPSAASALNPIDVLGDAHADRYQLAITAALADENVDALLLILTPQFMTDIEETARALSEAAAGSDKPVLACFMGQAHMTAAFRHFAEHSIPYYTVPERAVAALRAMVAQAEWQRTPLPAFKEFEVDRDRVAAVFRQVRAENRVQIGDAEARDILRAYDIPLPASKLCPTAEEAVAFAEEIGYPVVMKIASPDILHKTDIGGVRLNIEGPSDVRDSFDLLIYRAQRYQPQATLWGCLVQQQVRGGKELITGMSRDPQFGPLVMVGMGGIYVEVLKDVAFRIAPFSREEAEAMLHELRSARLLWGVRGERPADVEALVETLLKLSQLVTDFPEIVELDVNPLVVFEQGRGVMGIDMRLILEA